MKARILNGARQQENELHGVQSLLAGELESSGWEVASMILREHEISHCVGCFNCWMRTPGVCKSSGEGQRVAKSVIQSELAVFLTPLTFGGYSSELKKALDHIICLISPFFIKIDGETHHQKRYEKYPCILGIAVTPKRDKVTSNIFRTLVQRNAINLHAPAHVAMVVEYDEAETEMKAQFAQALKVIGGAL
ncbi:NADPH-dependent FMN reductase [Chloroherpeton thalassium ATCC 35110]|uniref:NADPH-dependent FMN reductase n=1 Tax=Chloroherpeton thalassium (strain ATCC 35110 / GB-78) TaxID=517418 RepID=B3QSJ4_CHLT3|nr:NAD(P)H-dependent oxidoreductase [Chloroherpeton thalassium]ACF14041.1 NADPH-dependent FMN reductase [Chloroherpeton thalassium ATCC 35110]